MLGWEARRKNQAKARIALGSFTNGKQIKITAVVFFIPSQKHSAFVSNWPICRIQRCKKLCCLCKGFPLLLP